MDTQPKVVISILTWNGYIDTVACLESIYRMNYENYEVVVIDNGSSDNSFDMIRNRYPLARIIQSKENMGYTGGNNIVMRYALEQRADYVWLLNNDTVVDRNALLELVNYIEERKNVGLVSSIIYYKSHPDRIQYAGSYIDLDTLDVIYPENNDIEHRKLFDVCKNVCVWGTALLIRTELIERVGYLDEKYFAYWEDTEYSIRSLKKGYRNAICYDSIVYHNTEPPQNKPKTPHFYFYMTRNEYMLKSSLLKGLKLLKFNIRYLANVLYQLSFFVSSCERENVLIDAVVNGAWNGLKNNGGNMTCAQKAPQIVKSVLTQIASMPPYLWSYILAGNVKKIVSVFKKTIKRYGTLLSS